MSLGKYLGMESIISFGWTAGDACSYRRSPLQEYYTEQWSTLRYTRVNAIGTSPHATVRISIFMTVVW
jgi:hypothetical protein